MTFLYEFLKKMRRKRTKMHAYKAWDKKLFFEF